MPRSDTDLITELRRLLTLERAALIAGDLDVMPALVSGKERLMAGLGGVPAPEATALEELRASARENQALLDAALQGIRSVREQIDVARSGGPAFSTYDSAGRSMSHGVPGPSHERRA